MGWVPKPGDKIKSAGFLSLRPQASPSRTIPISCPGGEGREEPEGEGEDFWAKLANGERRVGI